MPGDARRSTGPLSRASFWFLLALAIRSYVAVTTRIVSTDAVAYLDIARGFREGRFHEAATALLAPLYPFVVSGFSHVLDVERAAVCVSVLLGSLTVYPLYGLARRLVSDSRAWAPTFFFVFSPYLVRQSGDILSEPTYFFLVVCFLRLFFLVLDGRTRMSPGLGLTAGLAYLARPEGAGLLVATVLLLLLLDVRKARKIGSGLIVATVVFVAVAAPYMVLLKQQFGHWSLSPKGGYNLALAMIRFTGDTGITPSNVYGYIVDHPGQYLLKFGSDGLEALVKFVVVVHPLVLLLMLVGLFRGRLRISASFEGRYLLGMMVFFGGALALFWISRRFVTQLVPLGAVFFAGEGLLAVREWLVRWREGHGAKGGVDPECRELPLDRLVRDPSPGQDRGDPAVTEAVSEGDRDLARGPLGSDQAPGGLLRSSDRPLREGPVAGSSLAVRL